uniref:Si:dkey-111e8.4 n=1 Tax=Astyanax mexicanus TaxID=7994 RepID=A0A8B9H4J7_ASTMX
MEALVSQWLNSEIFIAFVVVLLLLIVALCAVCWILRCRRTPTTTERMAEIEIIPADGSDGKSPPRFILKIVTEEKHASELVQMLIEHRRVTKDTFNLPQDNLQSLGLICIATSFSRTSRRVWRRCAAFQYQQQHILPK